MPEERSIKHSQNRKYLELEIISTELRELVVEMLTLAKSGHSAGSLGTADIFAALYFDILNIDPQKPNDPDRDRFILSNGHVCPIWYATLHRRGFFHKDKLWTFRQVNSKLQGHPHYKSLPGIENSGGPLGQGLSQAVGLAIAGKMDNRNYRVYCMTGDGELNEGQIWEAAMLAPHYDLDNLVWIIDRNNIQIDGYTEHIMKLENLRSKLESFNWYVIEIDGHNHEEIINACHLTKAVGQRPSAIIAHTIPGKGVEFMQYKFEWHGKPPKKEEEKIALKELRTLKGRLKELYE